MKCCADCRFADIKGYCVLKEKKTSPRSSCPDFEER